MCRCYCATVIVLRCHACPHAGLLIGLGESRQQRLADLVLIRDLHQQHGHIQEVIIQSFRWVLGQGLACLPLVAATIGYLGAGVPALLAVATVWWQLQEL